jgi:hypothetical protein
MRVPEGFDWPMNKTWGGYLNPFSSQSVKCPDCRGSGLSPEAKVLHDRWYGNAPFKPGDRGSIPFTITDPPVRAFAERNVRNAPDYYGSGEQAIIQEAYRLCGLWNKLWMHHLNADDVAALVEAGRLHDLTHTWANGAWTKKEPPYMPTPKEVNDWSLAGMGHDSCNQWVVADAECKRLGYERECPRCHGEGTLWPTPEIKEWHDVWERTEPPSGDWYQLWETTSEGSPMSPAFKTPEELAHWLEDNKASSFGSDTASYKQWLNFIRGPGWAPSMIICDGEMKSGVAGMVDCKK